MAWNKNKVRNPVLREELDDVFTGSTSVASLDVTALKIGGTAVTATATELNTLDGVTASAAEINKLDGAGAAVASGTQASLIADPADGTTVDAEARTAINAIIDALQAFGIVAAE